MDTSLFKEALRLIFSRPITTLIAAMVLSLAMTATVGFFFISHYVYDAAAEVADSASAMVYVKANSSQTDVAQLKDQIDSQSDRVAKWVYRTVDQERERISSVLGSDLLTGVDVTTIPATPTFEIYFRPEAFDDLVATRTWLNGLKNVSVVSEIDFSAQHVEFLSAIGSTGRWATLVLLLISVLGSLSGVYLYTMDGLIKNRVALKLKRDLGAERFYIEFPYYLSAIVIAVVAIVVAMAVMLSINTHLNDVSESLPTWNLSLSMLHWNWFGLGALVAMLVAIAATAFAISRSKR